MKGSWKRLWLFAPRPTGKPAASLPSLDGDAGLTRTATSLLLAAGCHAAARQVVVAWHRRLQSTAGLARPAESVVLLNPRLQEFPDEVDRTLRHELAHLVVFARSRGRRVRSHGPEWRAACAELGIAGESRCHTLPLPRRRLQRTHVYRCPHCYFLLRRVRPIKARRRLACLECCKRHAGGRYDPRFDFVKIEQSPARAAASGHPSYPRRPLEYMVQEPIQLLFTMDESTKDKIQGAVNKTSGEIKQKIGAATDDPNLEDEGTGDKVKGKVQRKIGDIKQVFEK